MENTTKPPRDEALAGALFMVQMGGRVLPVARNTKRALLKDWVKQASNDVDVVMGWHQHHPGCNWGLVCDLIAVLDVDRHPNSPDGHAALAEIELEHGRIKTWCMHTPQNGLHYYFGQPEDKVRNLKRDDAGLEIKGTSGYALLAGSTTPHGVYRWDPELHPNKVTRTVLPAYVRAYVAGTPMKGNGKGNGPSWNMEHTPRECSSVPGNNSRESTNEAPGRLEHPLSSGQPRKTALAAWFETEVHEGGRNNALARGVGLMAAAGTPRPAATRRPSGGAGIDAARRSWVRRSAGRSTPSSRPRLGSGSPSSTTPPTLAALLSILCTNSPRWTFRRGATCLGRSYRRKASCSYSRLVGSARPTWR